MTTQTRSERREMTTGGRTTAIHAAIAPDPVAPAGVLVLHPWWGLSDDVRAYADRLAAEGFTAFAPDLYEGRFATTIEDADRLSTELDEDIADAFVLGALDALARSIGDPAARIGAIGFSMGAAWALWLPAQRPEVAATVVYYGTMEGPSLGRARVPVLGHFAADDPYEPEASVSAFEAALRSGRREVDIARYPATGHWFAEPSRDAFDAGAAELAWQRTVAFLRRHLVEGG